MAHKTEKPKFMFTNSHYKLSVDYDLLWKMIQEGQRVPAWLVQNMAEIEHDKTPRWDIVEVKNTCFLYPHEEFKEDYLIGTRGIGYEGYPRNFETFKQVCTKFSLHFILP